MNINVNAQIISKNNQPVFVVLPYEDYEKISLALEDLEDLKSIDEFRAGKQEAFPVEIAKQISRGISPIKVLRKYRGISQSDLAKQIGVTRQYLNQIESKSKQGNINLIKKIAKILTVSIDLLID